MEIGTPDPSTEAVRSAITAAVADVDELGLTGTDRAVSLAVVLAARLGLSAGNGSSGAAATPPAPEKPEHAGGGSGAVVNTGEGMVGKICAALKLERDVADLIYDEKDGELGYVLSARRLASDKANATRQIAQMIAAGRQAAGLEECLASWWTSYDPTVESARSGTASRATTMARLVEPSV